MFDYNPIVLCSWKSHDQTLNLNVPGTRRDVAPKQRPDNFPSVEDHIHSIFIFEHAWVTPRRTIIGGF